jgi:hypothetical protein
MGRDFGHNCLLVLCMFDTAFVAVNCNGYHTFISSGRPGNSPSTGGSDPALISGTGRINGTSSSTVTGIFLLTHIVDESGRKAKVSCSRQRLGLV